MARTPHLDDIHELTPMQRGMLFHSLLAPDDGAYVEQTVVRLTGPLDHAAFWRAWDLVVARHPSLRSAFHWRKLTTPVQTVHRGADLAHEEEDWRGLSDDEADKKLDELLRAERRAGFDLRRPPLIRVTLLRTGEDDHRVALRMSHLVVDGWSVGIVFSEFVEAYRAFHRGGEPLLAPPGSVRDHVAWWQHRDTREATAFWTEHLAGHRPHPPLRLGSGLEAAHDLPHDWVQASLADLAPALRQFAADHRVTLHTVFQAAWAVVLSRAVHTDDLVLGTTFAHRPSDIPGVERTVGCLLATAPIRTRTAPGTTVEELLQGVQDAIVAGRDHLGTSLTDIREALGSRSEELFESLVEFQNVPLPRFDLSEEGLELVDVHMDSRPHVPLTLLVLPFEDLPVRLVHDRRRVDTDSARRLLDAVRRTLASLVTGTARLVGDLDADPGVTPAAPPAAPAQAVPRRGSAATEEAVAALLRELLNVPAVGPEDDLIALGMHSLLGTRVVNRVADAFGVTVPLRALFEQPTVGALAALVDAGGATAQPAAAPAAAASGPDLAAEVTLDEAVRPAGPPRRRTEPGRFFLTGGTGTVGRHLLARLLRTTGATVDCLVRAEGPEDGARRLREALTEHDLWDDAFADRVHAVPGTLGRPRFGLAEEEFTALAERTEEIFHCGAVVNFLPPYRRIKPVNVDGCREILRLSVAGGAALPVHYVSSTAVFGEPEAGDRVHAETALPAAPPRQDHGYGQSKWVAEQIMALAAGRGLPVHVYRLGRMAGDSRTGHWKLGDVLSEAIRACVVLGLVPDTDAPVDLTPVDYAAAALVELSASRTGSGSIHHLTNPVPFRLAVLAEAMTRTGRPVRTVPPQEWYEALTELARTSPDGKWGMVLDILGPWVDELGRGLHEGRHETAATVRALGPDGPACPPADADLLAHYLRAFTASGFLPAHGEAGAQ